MKETTISKQIREHLKTKWGGISLKYHGSIYSVRGAPDIWACLPLEMIDGHVIGRLVLIETKQVGKHARKNQEQFLEMWRERGAIAGVCQSIEDVDKLIEDNV